MGRDEREQLIGVDKEKRGVRGRVDEMQKAKKEKSKKRKVEVEVGDVEVDKAGTKKQSPKKRKVTPEDEGDESMIGKTKKTKETDGARKNRAPKTGQKAVRSSRIAKLKK